MRVPSALSILLLSACTHATDLAGVGDAHDAGYPVPVLRSRWREDHEFCTKLARRSDRYSAQFLAGGIILGILSAGGVIVGNSIGPDKGENANWAAQNRNALIASASGLLAIPATLLFMRSNSASAASARAGAAMKAKTEEEAYEKCIDVRSELIASRAEASDYARGKFLPEKERQELEKKVSSLGDACTALQAEVEKSGEKGKGTPKDKEREATCAQLEAARRQLKDAQ